MWNKVGLGVQIDLGGWANFKTSCYPVDGFLAVSLCGCGSGRAANEDNVAAVQNVVTAFGERLKEVSLLAPEEVLVESIQNKYADMLAEELLAQWLASPSEAPGRVVSSPWPELIEIEDVTELSLQSYQVTGAVIEFTSVEQGTEDAGARRPIEVTVEKIDDQWRITAFTFGDREGATVYHNDEYGFTFSLPDSWQGFSVVSASWQGQSVENGEIIANGRRFCSGIRIGLRKQYDKISPL